MGYCMVGKKLAALMAVVMATIAATKGSMAPPPPACKNDLSQCYWDYLYLNGPSSVCCGELNKMLVEELSCLCANIADAEVLNTVVEIAARCNIQGISQNLCKPGAPRKSAAPLKDKTVAQKTTLIAVSTLLGFLLF